jgi:hypothetical protein
VDESSFLSSAVLIYEFVSEFLLLRRTSYVMLLPRARSRRHVISESAPFYHLHGVHQRLTWR